VQNAAVFFQFLIRVCVNSILSCFVISLQFIVIFTQCTFRLLASERWHKGAEPLDKEHLKTCVI